MEIFSNRLKSLRKELGISAKALGEKIGVSDASIINWENNVYDIKGEYIIRLAKFFGVSADYLLGIED
ncbi:MAG: helix-turn-helix transcriptional regulator [Clostridiales bacterium]|nr:helix-turn-helix transcriptional regulator [Clostridiales bacterium]